MTDKEYQEIRARMVYDDIVNRIVVGTGLKVGREDAYPAAKEVVSQIYRTLKGMTKQQVGWFIEELKKESEVIPTN